MCVSCSKKKNATSLLLFLFAPCCWLLLPRIATIDGQPVPVPVQPVIKMEWNQIGNDIIEKGIDGRNLLYGTFGRHVAMSADGTTITIDASIYKWNDSSDQYIQFEPNFSINGSESIDTLGWRFGWSLTLSADGNTVAVGGRKERGYVDVFRVDATTTQSTTRPYHQIGSDIRGTRIEDSSTSSMVISMSADGHSFIVGTAGGGDLFGPTIFGLARVFQLNVSSPNGYTQIGPDFQGAEKNDFFGASVAMSADGTTIAVGAPLNGPGQVRIYKFDPINNFHVPFYNRYGEKQFDRFGHSLVLSADGSTIAVGAIASNDNTGKVRVFKLDSFGQGDYTPVEFDIEGEAAGDFAGFSLAMSADGTTIAVGAYRNNGSGFGAGHVRVYKFDTVASQYKQIGSDIDGEGTFQEFGYSLDTSNDGTMIVVGAPYSSGAPYNPEKSGHVRVYRYSPVLPTRCGMLCWIWRFICSVF